MRLEGKVVIVAGAGPGIGHGIVRCLAEDGADVAVVDINRDYAEKVAGEVKALGRKSLGIGADLTDDKQVKKAVQDTIDTFGKVDILVNVVGGLSKSLLARTSFEFADQEEAEWDDTFKLNLKTHFLTCRAVVPYFIKQKSGKIVNVSSIAGKGQNPRNMAYGAVKAGVITFTKALASALAEHNINVNCICPGVVYTPFWEAYADQFIRFITEAKGMTPRDYFLKTVVARVPLKREQTPEDMGHAVSFLVSEDARNITGQSLNIDGGLVMD